MTKTTTDAGDLFTADMARRYDERNAALAPITSCLHFLTNIVLRGLPEQAHVLSVGAGTGAEILSLARAFPAWTFVALDPSAPMLETCRARLADAGVADRCTFMAGQVENAPFDRPFDAALSLFVAHFVGRDARLDFLGEMTRRLRSGGVLATAEISFDLGAPEYEPMLGNWAGIQSLMGATHESLAALPAQLRDVLTVLPPDETEELWRESGIPLPVRFFQAFMVHGWYGVKP
jgi:tRNA (cmo5U34)-methyltransferase